MFRIAPMSRPPVTCSISFWTSSLTFFRAWLTAARVFSNGFAAAISALLTVASWQFVMSQRSLGQEFAFGIPRWVVQSLIVVGFALVTLRLVWHAADRWR